MNKMEEIIEGMAEYICDKICRYNADASLDDEQMDNICYKCEMGDHICHVLNEYERVIRNGRDQTAAWTDRVMNRFLQVN